MSKIKINLLPPEVLQSAKVKAQKQLIDQISIIFMVIVIMAVGGLFGLVIYQKNLLDGAQSELATLNKQVKSLESQEGLLLSLKHRIDTTRNLYKEESKQASALQLITTLSPQEIKVNSLSIDKSAIISYNFETYSLVDILKMFDSLTDPSKSEGRISKVSVENLNMNSANQFRGDLLIRTK
jgi:hypothetical protein